MKGIDQALESLRQMAGSFLRSSVGRFLLFSDASADLALGLVYEIPLVYRMPMVGDMTRGTVVGALAISAHYCFAPTL